MCCVCVDEICIDDMVFLCGTVYWISLRAYGNKGKFLSSNSVMINKRRSEI